MRDEAEKRKTEIKLLTLNKMSQVILSMRKRHANPNKTVMKVQIIGLIWCACILFSSSLYTLRIYNSTHLDKYLRCIRRCLCRCCCWCCKLRNNLTSSALGSKDELLLLCSDLEYKRNIRRKAWDLRRSSDLAKNGSFLSSAASFLTLFTWCVTPK